MAAQTIRACAEENREGNTETEPAAALNASRRFRAAAHLCTAIHVAEEV